MATSKDIKDPVALINELLASGEPGNISEDPMTGYTGYQPQAVIDAMNTAFDMDKWGFDEISSEVIIGDVKGVKTESLVESQIKVWIGDRNNYRIAWGQGRITRGDRGDARKSAQTDGLKKALSYFSIGNRAYLGLLDANKKANVTPVKDVQPVKEPVAEATKFVTYAQQGKISALYNEKGLDREAMRLVLKKRYGVESHKEMTVSEASDYISYLMTLPAKDDVSMLDGNLPEGIK